MRVLTVYPGKQSAIIDDSERQLIVFYEYRRAEVYPAADGTDWPGWRKFLECRYCHGPVPDIQAGYAFRQLQQQTCSMLCSQREFMHTHYCCRKASPVTCVCMYAYTCPDHGERHVGTHD